MPVFTRNQKPIINLSVQLRKRRASESRARLNKPESEARWKDTVNPAEQEQKQLVLTLTPERSSFAFISLGGVAAD